MLRSMNTDFWVFGYGSLMWKPGFRHEEAVPAVLHGYHRSFCIYSHHYRGTPEYPGLVLGLSPGGHCSGVAFRVAPEDVQDVTDYLHERELVAYAYREERLPVTLTDGREVEAWCCVADSAHRQYAGDLGVTESAQIIMEACGQAGLNRDYLINTVRQLEAHGFTDPPLHALLREVERLTGILNQGEGI